MDGREQLMHICTLIEEVANTLPDGDAMDNAYFALKGAIHSIYDADAILEEHDA